MKPQESEMTRPPQPVPTQETQPFWDAAREGRVVLWHCADCGRIAAPLSPRCPDCLSGDLRALPYEGRVLLKGRTVLTVPAYQGQSVPAPVAECVIEDEPRVTLIAADPDDLTRDLAPGTPVTLGFVAEGDSVPLATITREATS